MTEIPRIRDAIRRSTHPQHAIVLMRIVSKWSLLSVAVGICTGTMVALFLAGLDLVTEFHWRNPWLLYLLPIAGVVSIWMYRVAGKEADGGNNLILEEVYHYRRGVPVRMAPLVLVGTWLTHLFGGSAGREGTAVQMGAAIAAGLGRWLSLSMEDVRKLLLCGVAAGFGAVFGTPVAGAVFAVEFLVRGRVASRLVVPCFLSALAGDQVVLLWGIDHTSYSIAAVGDLHLLVMIKVVLAAICFGIASLLFSETTHWIQGSLKRWVATDWLRPVCGALVVIGLVHLFGTRDYLGLGVSAPPDRPNAVTIQSAFQSGGAGVASWFLKLIFTAVTVGSGFKGGEVTPLFFIGATLGHCLGLALGIPVGLMAALGFVAVFAGATKTPIASVIMAIELFAPHSPDAMRGGFVIYAAIACFVANAVSGSSSIYRSQKHAEDEDL
ncbi:chloride channel protein [Pirellulaceae bacterium SH501]